MRLPSSIALGLTLTQIQNRKIDKKIYNPQKPRTFPLLPVLHLPTQMAMEHKNTSHQDRDENLDLDDIINMANLKSLEGISENYPIFNISIPISVEQALCHPYLAPLHDVNEEPVCPRPFSFDFEQPTFTEENIKELIWRESEKFNPEP